MRDAACGKHDKTFTNARTADLRLIYTTLAKQRSSWNAKNIESDMNDKGRASEGHVQGADGLRDSIGE